MRLRSAVVVALFCFCFSTVARAQQRTITIELTPTVRTQLAIWIESADGTIFQTLRLTDAIAYRGLGNRPGALQMNSGYHWPYGRREGALPIWAHRRFEATGVTWRRVVFAGRTSEGDASRAGVAEAPNTADHYYCLSFTGHETLDAVSCASVFMSNKGHFLTSDELAAGYAEPFEDMPGVGRMRQLSMDSLYPPRGDVMCTGGCLDEPDVQTYPAERVRVMPELDAVTMATPPRDVPFTFTFDLPSAWPDGDYTVFVEANTEGDLAAPTWAAPTPTTPASAWDWYAINDGYAYRGQPSVLYAVDVRVGMPTEDGYTTSAPIGHGDLHGLSGDMSSMTGSGIVDDPAGHPGSGADRLRAGPDGVRLTVTVPVLDPCSLSTPPPECGHECDEMHPCSTPLLCGPDFMCVGRCTIPMEPPAPIDVTAAPVEDIHHSHEWAHFTLTVPEVMRGIGSYEVRVGTSPIVDAASFAAARPAKAATIEDQGLVVPTTAAPGETVTVDVGQLLPSSPYWIGVRVFDGCNAAGAIAAAEVRTTAIHFTTVSPCFVATAAYGSPLDAHIGVLRRARDRWLMPHAPGRAVVRAYYELGPAAAAWIADDEDRRAWARSALDLIVRALE
jgi:hypothetical protein